jgi:hypothetical protein
VVAAHGAGLSDIFFSGEIDVVVLYPNQTPPNYFHTLARGLGQRHHFLCHDRPEEDSDFEADIPGLLRILEEEVKASQL